MAAEGTEPLDQQVVTARVLERCGRGFGHEDVQGGDYGRKRPAWPGLANGDMCAQILRYLQVNVAIGAGDCHDGDLPFPRFR